MLLDPVQRHILLRAGLHVLDHGRAPAHLLLAQDHDAPGPGGVRRPHLRLEAPVRVDRGGGQTILAEGVHQVHDPPPRGVSHGHDEHIRSRPGRRLHPLLLHGQDRPLDPDPEPDARRGRPAQFLDQPVVAPAPSHRALRPDPLRPELEDGLRVVVEPPHEPGIERIPDVQRREVALQGPEVRRALLAEPFGDLRRACDHRLAGRDLAIQQPERVDLQPPLAVPAHLRDVVPIIGHEPFQIGGPALRTAEAVELEGQAGDAQPPVERQRQVDDLRVQRRVDLPEGLHPELVVLPKASGLGPLIPKVRGEVVELDGLRQRAHAVLQVGADHRGRAFGPEGEAVPPLVQEGVHLLVHDVRPLPHAPHEQARLLEHGRPDPAIPVEACQVSDDGFDPGPEGPLVGQDVPRATGSLEFRKRLLSSSTSAEDLQPVPSPNRGSYGGAGDHLHQISRSHLARLYGAHVDAS